MSTSKYNGAQARDLINKVRTAISRGIDALDDGKGTIGVARLTVLIKQALERDPVGTLKALAAYAPKDVTVETYNGKTADQYSDDELASMLASRALQRAKQGDTDKELGNMLQ